MKLKISHLITDFFSIYLISEAGLSDNTVKSYRDTFVLFFKYLDESGSCRLKNLDISVFTADTISGFLNWIEETRQCSINTRNQRLAAIKSFISYIIRRSPEDCKNCQDILSIRIKKAPQAVIDYLSIDAIALILEQPDKHTKDGLRDLSILSLMYETGCRVQELIDIKVGDICFRSPNTVKLTGKGCKSRIVPISANVASIIKGYIIKSAICGSEQILFMNRSKQKLSRSGVAYILNKYMHMAKVEHKDMFGQSIHPHVLRHSKAMHLLENGVNLIYIRDFLGHTSVTTTEIYAKCNPELKRKYIEESANLIGEAIEPYSEKEKESLLSWLKNNI